MSQVVVIKPFPIRTTLISGQCMPPHLGYRPKVPNFLWNVLSCQKPKPQTPPGTMKAKKVQTMYRESEAQTHPYDVEVIPPENKELEILTLGWLSWDHGLPAGMHEITIIERARQKRAWEKAVPIPCDEETLKIRRMVIERIEINEWNFRQEEIETLNELRMELAEEMMKKLLEKNKVHVNKRVSSYVTHKMKERIVRLHKVRKDFDRNIRKLVLQRDKINKKYHKWNIIKEHENKTSEFWGPQMAFGENPRRWHEIIYPQCRYNKVFSNLEVIVQDYREVPCEIEPYFDYLKHSKPRRTGREIIISGAKWSEDHLEQLYNELKFIRLQRFRSLKPCRLKTRIPLPVPEPLTPSVKAVPDWEEDLFQASLFLQKTLKGRAIQAVMFEGRVRSQELIEELRSTHALQKLVEDEKSVVRKRIYGLQRQNEINAMREKRKQEVLQYLEGKTHADLLDFLSKELLRLQDERKTHAYAILADRERHKREAAEAGRRQEEEQRRREHDEMFKQIVKSHQNTVDLYFEEVIMETSDWLAERESREYIHKIAQRVDEAAYDAHIRANHIEQEEIIADLLHNYALPEAEKRIVRDRLKARQRNYLKVCHEEVYGSIEDAMKGPRLAKGVLLQLPRPTKHKIPPRIPVKVMRLKRMRSPQSSSSLETTSPEDLSKSGSANTIATLPTVPEEAGERDKPNWSTGYSKQNIILEFDDPSTD